MNIGIDIDGVIIDFPDRVRVQADWYDCEVFKKNGAKKKDELNIRTRYSWNNEELKRFIDDNFVKLAKESSVIPFAKEVIERLKEDNNKIIIITARGDLAGKQMIEIAKEQLNESNISYDKIYWNVSDKTEICKKEKIDFMIDDYADICEDLIDEKIRTLYFRAKDNRKLEENFYLKEVSNWPEIYRFIKENNKKGAK